MAAAISLFITAQTIEDTNVKLSLTVLYYDAPLGISEEAAVYAFFPPTATPTQIENAIEEAIIEQASSNYPTMNLNRNNIIMLDIKRGS